MFYPMFADLAGRRCVVVGGGLVAQRKVATLLGYGGRVTVVSPTATARLRAYASSGRIDYRPRRFRPSDLQGAWLVYAATDDQRANEQVFRTASERRIFTNVVDQKPLCSFIAPAIFRRGPLVIAVSTGGGSPALAKKVRDDLGRVLGRSYVPMLQLLSALRDPAKRRLQGSAARKRYFDALVRGRVFKLVRAGKVRAARQEALERLARQACLAGRQAGVNGGERSSGRKVSDTC